MSEESGGSGIGRKLFTYGFLAASIVVAWQSWVNSTITPQTLSLSEEAARTVAAPDENRPRMQRSDPIQQRFEWHTSAGTALVTCRREFVFFGSWQCTAVQGELGSF